MKFFSLLFALAMSLAVRDSTARAAECSERLREIGLQASAADHGIAAEKAKGEIAALILEKAKLAKSSDGALISLIEKNINAKIADFESRFGQKLDAAQLKKIILETEILRQSADQSEKTREQDNRRREKVGGLNWSIEPVMVKEKFITPRQGGGPYVVDAYSSEGDDLHFLMSYEGKDPQTLNERYVANSKTGTTTPIGEWDSQPEFYEGADGTVVVGFQSSRIPEEVSLGVFDLKTGQTRSVLLRDVIPDFDAKDFMGRPVVYTYQRDDGKMGILFNWYDRVAHATLLYSLDLGTNIATELSPIKSDTRFYKGPDARHVYGVELSATVVGTPGGFGRAIIVKNILTGAVIHSQVMDLAYALEAKVDQISLFESSTGALYLAYNFYGEPEISIRNLTSGEVKKFKRNSGDRESGVFAEDSAGTVYYLPNAWGQATAQSIFNLKTGQATTKAIPFPSDQRLSHLRLVGVTSGTWAGPLMVYHSTATSLEQSVMVTLPVADNSPAAVITPLSSLHGYRVDNVVVAKSGRVFALVKGSTSGTNGHSLSLIQVYGPLGGVQ